MRRYRAPSQEAILHRQVCDYLRRQYPRILFRTDFAAGTKMTIGQAKKHKMLQSCRAWPDLFIAEARGCFFGLFLELKAKNSSELLTNGELGNSEHIREQREVLAMLSDKGYIANFAIGFDDAKQQIDLYMSRNRTQGVMGLKITMKDGSVL